MKFKTLFFLFNLILITAFAFVFLMPLPILGWEYALSFWGQNWPLSLVFLGVLLALDGYFVANWRLFRLLEREDWPGLRRFLEAELEAKGPLGLQKTRILINACLIGQEPKRIDHLRQVYVEKQARALPRLALSLALPAILEGRTDEIEAFLGPYVDDRRTRGDQSWIRWAVAFGRLLRQDGAAARPLLELDPRRRHDPLLELLSLYLLDNLRSQDEALGAQIDQRRQALAGRWTDKEWDSAIEAWKERVVLAVFLDKLITEARQWLREVSS